MKNTSATRQVLLEAPKEEFFSSVKQMRNKSTEQLLPYVKEFFLLFLV
jgi:hypothetical protein